MQNKILWTSLIGDLLVSLYTWMATKVWHIGVITWIRTLNRLYITFNLNDGHPWVPDLIIFLLLNPEMSPVPCSIHPNLIYVTWFTYSKCCLWKTKSNSPNYNMAPFHAITLVNINNIWVYVRHIIHVYRFNHI